MYNTRPTYVQINVDNLRENVKNIKSNIKEDTKLCLVVKANAYAHGAVAISKILESDADYFAVATLEEALELRYNDIKKPILCLGYIPPDGFCKAIENNIDITIYSIENAKFLNEECKKIDKEAKVHIKLDTGMSRIGFKIEDSSVEEIKEIHKLSHINIIGIYSHFAKADEEDKSFTHKQYERFIYIVEILEKENIYIPIKHICNSAGIIDFPSYHLDMVRSGIIVYGHYPSECVDKNKIKLRPVMTLKTKLSHIKYLDGDIGISYGLRYVTDGKTKIGTIPIGYADGFTRLLSNKISVKIKNKVYPVVGSICMDQCMVKLDDEKFEINDDVIVFGEDDDIKLERIADILGTINYEILCMVSRRVLRVYLEGNKVLQILDYLVK